VTGWLLVVLAVLVGCSKPEQGSTLPPLPSPTPSASGSASPAPAGTDLQQIIALTKDYYAESNRAANTGDTRRLRSMSTPGCSCLAAIDFIDHQWKSGRISAPGYYQLSEVSFPKVTSPTTAFATAVYTTRREVDYNAAGQPVRTTPANPKTQTATLDFIKIGGAWKVADLVRHT
jgi:hypothetical protein